MAREEREYLASGMTRIVRYDEQGRKHISIEVGNMLHPKANSNTVVSGRGLFGSWKMCKHNLTPFQIGEYTVYLSGSNYASTETQGPTPDAAVYLAPGTLGYGWKVPIMFGVNTDEPFEQEGSLETIFLNWPDMGVVPEHVLYKALAWAERRLKEGKKLEIACVGGHGRTGTFAACLTIQITGVEAKVAIEGVRKTYCKEAIESESQEKLIGKVETWK